MNSTIDPGTTAQKRKRIRNRGGEKRKREDDGDNSSHVKRQEPMRPEQTTYDEAVSMMDPSLLSDHFAKALKKHSSDSTTLELEDEYIPTRVIRNTTSFSEPHLAKTLPAFLETFGGGIEELGKGQTAAPHTLIITQSGIRAADLARELRSLANGSVTVAKLFAKHMKLAQCISFVEKTKINIAVGTPQRPKELVEQKIMKLDQLKRIVIDGSYVDDKKRTIFELREVFLMLVQLLNMDEIKSRLGAEEDAIEILVF